MKQIYRPPGLRLYILACVTASLIGSAGARAEPGPCEVRSHSQKVAILVCPPALDANGWRDAGRKACADSNGVCNAWIWNDGDLAPTTAPATDGQLDRDAVRNAVAVWVDDSQRLVRITKVEK